MGTAWSCTLQGLLFTFGSITVPSYFTGISIYFLLVIKMNTTEETIQKYVEPVVHLGSLLFGVLVGILGLIAGFEGGMNMDCPHCRIGHSMHPSSTSSSSNPTNTTIHDDKYSQAIEQLQFWSIFISTCIIIINMAIVHHTLSQQDKTTRRISIGLPAANVNVNTNMNVNTNVNVTTATNHNNTNNVHSSYESYKSCEYETNMFMYTQYKYTDEY